MAPVRHRRRLHAARLLAVLAPLGAAGLVVAGVLTGGPLLVASALAGVAVAGLLGAVLLRVERAARVEVATVRAAQAAAYAREQERHAGEHRSFTTHLVRLLDAAEARLGALRGRLDEVQAEVLVAREALADAEAAAAETPSQALVRLGDGTEWDDLWPDLADAPTVVDLIGWEDRVRLGLLPAAHYAEDEPRERSA